MADRFYFDGPLGPGDVTLDGPEAHHLVHVRRFALSDCVTLFNGDGHEYPAAIVEISKKRATLHVTDVATPDREIGFSLHIAAALPKGDRGDFLIEKLTELALPTSRRSPRSAALSRRTTPKRTNGGGRSSKPANSAAATCSCGSARLPGGSTGADGLWDSGGSPTRQARVRCRELVVVNRA